ncbi:gamma-glutamyltransferase [Thiotrichales bacterium 19S3-7]|nr:gamma-glutamyltransferase [Thiotrichales bacterium 19S3-7]MCF6801920.1 gamma-glutamyltransferase [Thiotrichales bacterium 19S3-11]
MRWILKINYLLSIVFLSVSLPIAGFSAYWQPVQESPQRFHPVESNYGMVATQESLATTVGVNILNKGGNAVDAAVAVGFALAVTMPKAGNLGGGGFMLIWLNDQKKAIAINYREKAPMAATKDMFLDKNGNVDENLISGTYKASGVPGTVKGLILAQETYGKLPLKEVIQPAIDLAENGFEVSYAMAESLSDAKTWLFNHSETRKIFLNKANQPYQAGQWLVQKQLAETLKRIRDTKGEDFYTGKTAKILVKDMKENGGLITLADLKAYEAEQLKPVTGVYQGYHIYSMPPPSSGGVTLIELLNILAGFDLGKFGLNSAETIHLMTEAESYAYNDRNSDLGDPDFVHNPVEHLTSRAYADTIRKQINRDKHVPSSKLSDVKVINNESNQTTQFSVVDHDGNMVSNTYTLNYSYGSGIIAKGLGFFLNNEMDDFTAKVGVANSFGLVQGKANSIEPGKRPLSSMTPTIVITKDNQPFLATGSPGGSRIITTTLQVILNIITHHLNLQSAVNAPRVHSQLWPDQIQIEQGISPDTIKLLEKMGHEVILAPAMGSANSVLYQESMFYGARDPRREGALAKGDNNFNH